MCRASSIQTWVTLNAGVGIAGLGGQSEVFYGIMPWEHSVKYFKLARAAVR
jgi:hypothetical protein